MISELVVEKKQKLREISKKERDKIFLSEGSIFSKIISEHFNTWFKTQKFIRNLAFYYPINSEVDPFPIVKSLKNSSLNFCLPIVKNQNSPLIFREWRESSKLIKSNFGVKIPDEGKLLEPDLIVIPLLSYDDNGSRLGYGGGYYDRTLFYFRKINKKKIFTMGLAFSCQKYSGKLPTEINDEKIDSVLTEDGFQFFDQNN